MIDIIKASDKAKVKKIKQRSTEVVDKASGKVKKIAEDVKKTGDRALIRYTKKFDKIALTKNKIQVNEKDIKDAYKKVNPKIINSLKVAAINISRYAKYQLPCEWKKKINEGIIVGQVVRPLDSVGCYVPGGNYPLVSSVLMTVVPAKIAGVKEIIVCCPKITKEILAACDIAGADKVFRVGGAQAIAAMAYGTETIPKVNKIVGPGNVYVTAAKKYVYGDVGIDFLAGPSEIMIIAEKANPEFIAADMLAQAEHDVMASAILATPSISLAKKVKQEIEKQIKNLKTKAIAKKSLENFGVIVVVNNIDEAFEFVNEFAPEHLEIMTYDENVLSKVRNAGAVFLGDYSPEAAGDYCSGPNHVLPTQGVARFRAGLSVMDFLKMPTFQRLTKGGLEAIKNAITDIAELEGLDAHSKSIKKRFEND
jgi:histidinol dehydrogenase